MSERINQIKDKIIEFWNKYTLKQKVVVFSLIGGIAIALVLVCYFISIPTYVRLVQFDDAKNASDIIDALEEKGIEYRYESDDKLTRIEVVEGSLDEAMLLI